ncbi:hypothetical protein MMRN_33880 [Mycobacterium marinum]|nr:hypothetical protein MMRN_33880 [Mycobacterium marinum]
MLAPLLSLAFPAADGSAASPLPQDTEPPSPLDAVTGTNSPIAPATKSTAATAMINRRTVTVRPWAAVSPWATGLTAVRLG